MQLAEMHCAGSGVPGNCSAAQEYLTKSQMLRLALHASSRTAGPISRPQSGLHCSQTGGAVQLAEMHWAGSGVPGNCSVAQEYLATFLEERAAWRDDIEAAVAFLDGGNAGAGLLRMAQVGCRPGPAEA